MGFCTNCGRAVRDDMTFCPECGADLSANETVGARPRRGLAPPASQMAGQGPVPYPGVPYGFPMYYRPPMTGKRVLTVAGAVILIIDACLATMLGLFIISDSDYVLASTVLVGAGVLSIVCAVGVFASFKPIFNIMGPIGLAFSALVLWAVENDAIIVCIIGLTLAIVSLMLIGLGWGDMVARHTAKSTGLHPSMAGFPPFAGGARPPPYGGAEPPSLLNLRK